MNFHIMIDRCLCKKCSREATFLFLLFMSLFNCVAEVKNPDFAYPQTVKDNADTRLKKALEEHDYPIVLQSAMRIAIADKLISSDDVKKSIELYGKLAESLPSPYKEIARLLEAREYVSVYNENPWIYNNRTLPLSPVPEDIKAWSCDIFSAKVRDLVISSMENTKEAKNTPLTEISPILVDWKNAAGMGMTVYDFMTMKAVDILKPFKNNGVSSIPFRRDNADTVGFAGLPISEIIGNILSDNINWHDSEGDSRIASVFSYMKYQNLPYEEQKDYLKLCIDTYKDTPYCARFILEYTNRQTVVEEESFYGEESDSNKELLRQNNKLKKDYAFIESYLKRFPDCLDADVLRQRLQQLCDESITVSVNGRVYPGKKGKVTVHSNNVLSFNLLVVKVPQKFINGSITEVELRKSGKVVESISVSFNGNKPENFERELDLAPLESGVYVLVPSKTGDFSGMIKGLQSKLRYSTFNVSSLQYFISSDGVYNKANRIYVTDGLNNKPVKGARIILTSYRNKVKTDLVTNAQGYAEFEAGSYDMTIRYGQNRLDNNIWVGDRYGSQQKGYISGRLITDLAIYHPGDSIGFLAVSFSGKDRDLISLGNHKVKVFLYDVNWQKVDSIGLTTDSFGRASGKLHIPDSGLLGNYTLSMVGLEDGNAYASNSVEIADYKSPTFYVTIDGTEKSYKIGDKIIIKGKVSTYSGVPVSDAVVKFDLSYQMFPWYNSNINANYGGEVKSGSDGKFSIELGTEDLRNTRYKLGCYKLLVSAVNPAGETQSASPVYLSLGSAYSIRPDIQNKIEAGRMEKFAVRVVDIVGTPVEKKVYYRIVGYDDKKVICNGEFISPVFYLNTDSLPSGKYNVVFSLNKEFKNTVTEHNSDIEFIIYRDIDKHPPYETALWVPENHIVVPSDSKEVKIRFGSAYPDSWIYVQVADLNNIIERKWVRVNDMNDELKVAAPANNNRVFVTLSGMHGFESRTETITIIPKAQTENIEVNAVSFRESLTPGAKESWKFSFILADKSLAGIPVAAVMTNQALNHLVPFNWVFNPYSELGYTKRDNLQLSYNNAGGYLYLQITRASLKSANGVVLPNWNLYGYESANGKIYIRGTKNLSRRATADGVIQFENVVNQVASSAAVTAPAMKMQATGEIESESKDVAEPTEKGSGSASTDVENDALREIDCPLAFFMPELMTDASGEALVEFEVPQFNGTWQFQIMGYTPEMRGVVKKLSAVSSKPVMVQMNAPRFIRTGDIGSISAMLYNNSLDELSLHGRIEIFNPVDGSVLKKYDSVDYTVDPGGSVAVATEFDVPDNISMLGFRVYAYGDKFTDGEQTIIPVYPSSTPVIESQPFYIAPGQNDFSMKIKGDGKSGDLTLVYCDNPVWEVVKALPALVDRDSDNALSLVNTLFGNAVGFGLINRYPELKEGLTLFSDPENSADSSLVSNLEKNQNIKNVLLNNTPWVRNASSETLRMQSLIKFTDESKCKSEIASQVKKLDELQNADGGWSWCVGMKSSDFVTSQVLQHLGMLRKMQYMPAGLDKAAERGVKYVDDCWVKNLQEYRGNIYPYASMLDYLYIRSNFKGVRKSSAFATMTAKAITAIKAEWKRFNIYDKATAASVLSRYGYPMEARSILESLRQYAKISDESGMWFDNLSSSRSGMNKLLITTRVLDAYQDIDPESGNIDRLRQWLLISRQTEDWGRNVDMAEVINAILTSGSKWTVNNGSAEIYIGGERLDVSKVAKLTGSLTATINNNRGSMLEIKRASSGPAWGGVVNQYVDPIKDVKSAKCQELSVDKRIYLITVDKDGADASNDLLKVGDKVRVTIILKCNKDMEYVAVTDSRPACLEPVEQVSGYGVSDGVGMYKEIKGNATNLFIPFLAKGTHVISYDCYVDREGIYASGIATAQSQYAPEIAAHSAGSLITISE